MQQTESATTLEICNSNETSTSNEKNYKEFTKQVKEMRQRLLSSPGRFQTISGREDKSVIPPEVLRAQTLGRFFIQHRGCLVMKTADDQAILRELLAHVAPATVIELGTYTGGNAVWIADQLKAEGIESVVYSMDIDLSIVEDKVKNIKPDNVTFLQGNAYEIEKAFTPEFLASSPHPWVVIEDCHHNTTGILEHFRPQMKTGDYFVVEDTSPDIPYHLGAMRFHNEYVPHGTHLLNALKDFLKKCNGEFAVDSFFTDFFGYNGTWNWHGYIRKM